MTALEQQIKRRVEQAPKELPADKMAEGRDRGQESGDRGRGAEPRDRLRDGGMEVGDQRSKIRGRKAERSAELGCLWGWQLKIAGNNPWNRNVLIQVFPSQGKTIQSDLHLLELIIGGL